jgi:hypothetical protein
LGSSVGTTSVKASIKEGAGISLDACLFQLRAAALMWKAACPFVKLRDSIRSTSGRGSRETSMRTSVLRPLLLRLSLLSLALIASFGAIDAASAQSPTTYPWCSKYFGRGGGGRSCYYTSYAQCMTTVSGVGGYCFHNPYLGTAPGARRYRRL